jgi:hypothetical protein
VQNAAVVAALVLPGRGFFFEDRDVRVGQTFQQSVPGRQPNDAPTGNHHAHERGV